MAEYSNNDVQIVNPGESVIFTTTVVPCTRGLIRHRDETGSFLLSGYVPYGNRMCSCCTKNKSAQYFSFFGGNISLPTGATVEAISLALVIDGATVPSTTMTVTPAAVNEYFNVSRAANIDIWNGCCETLSIRNTSAQPIQLQNANIIITRPDLVLTR